MDFGGQYKVMLLEKLIKSQLYTEYQNNKRLQWMVVFILLILALSLLKSLSETVNKQQYDTLQQINLLARLTQSANNTVDADIVKRLEETYYNATSSLPQASSPSTAEAQALIEVEQKIGSLLTRKRLNLLGSEPFIQRTQTFWSVRIEVSGQLTENKLIDLLKYFDSGVKHRRIASFQYSPKTSNTINLVIDLMYMRANND
jgi:hypothetical protein